MKQDDILARVKEFTEVSFLDHRYSSFDYCYNYFRANENDRILEDIEKSCAILGFYLASWGMYRGSSFLLQKSYRYFINLINYISSVDGAIWKIKPDKFIDKESQEMILEIYKKIKENIIEDENQERVLITKIMLGVFGIIPAFDTYFCKAFKEIEPNTSRFTKVNKESLSVIGRFYIDNEYDIVSLSKEIKTKDFITGKARYQYTAAKIIDMYGFVNGTKI